MHQKMSVRRNKVKTWRSGYSFLLGMLCLIYSAFPVLAQQSFDTEFYLVDTLPLESISAAEKELIDTNVAHYHARLDDTLGLYYLSYIVEESWNDYVWPPYNAFILEEVNRALENHPEGTPLHTTFLKYKATAMTNMGYYYNNTSDFARSLDYYDQATLLWKKLNNRKELGILNINIGAVQAKQGNVQEALKRFEDALRINEEMNDSSGIAYTLSNLANLYSIQEDTMLAIEYSERALEIRRQLSDYRTLSVSYNNLAALYYRIGRKEIAFDYFSRSVAIKEEQGDVTGLVNTYNNIGAA